MIQPVRPELAAAWQKYFTQKSGLSPDIPGQILPVVILDDNSRGPYQAYRGWHAGVAIGAFAGNYSYCGIANVDDPAKQKSVIVVDEIWAKSPVAATDFLVSLTTQTQPSLAFSPAADADA